MKVIDLLNKMTNYEPIPNKIKLECVNNITKENCTYEFNPLEENYINKNGKLLTDAACFGTLLHLEIEIIEEPKGFSGMKWFKNGEEIASVSNDGLHCSQLPKEELEEIELIEIPIIDDIKNKRMVENEMKINELIANQNKIIKGFKNKDTTKS